MALNKKQQKQIDAAKNKILRLRELLKAAKNQPDDPKEIPRLEKEIADLNAEISKYYSKVASAEQAYTEFNEKTKGDIMVNRVSHDELLDNLLVATIVTQVIAASLLCHYCALLCLNTDCPFTCNLKSCYFMMDVSYFFHIRLLLHVSIQPTQIVCLIMFLFSMNIPKFRAR